MPTFEDGFARGKKCLLLARRWFYYWNCYKCKIASIVKIILRIENPVNAKIFVIRVPKTLEKLKQLIGPFYDYEYTGNIKMKAAATKEVFIAFDKFKLIIYTDSVMEPWTVTKKRTKLKDKRRKITMNLTLNA